MPVRLKIAISAAVFFGLVAAYGIHNFLRQQREATEAFRSLTVSPTLQELANLKSQMKQVNAEFEIIARNMKSVESHDLNKRMEKLESHIQESPEKAMSVFVLRRDMDQLKAEVLRVQQSNNWTMGFALSTMIGLLGILLPINFYLLKDRKSADFPPKERRGRQ